MGLLVAYCLFLEASILEAAQLLDAGDKREFQVIEDAASEAAEHDLAGQMMAEQVDAASLRRANRLN